METAMTHSGSSSPPTGVDPAASASLEAVAKALRGLRFGMVTITVHDGMIVQVDRTEKLRLPRPA